MENVLQKSIGTAAFALRGYDVNNLGRTPELLEHPAYGPLFSEELRRASELCSAATGRRVDLARRIRSGAETTLETYAEDLAAIVAVELAQLRALKEFFGISFADARLAFGYSLGEVTALVAAGVYDIEAVLHPILSMADDAAELARDVRLGVLFSRGTALDLNAVRKLCLQISNQGEGVVSISSYLSPNTVLLLGQNGTVREFKRAMHDVLKTKVQLRINPHRWPPMHTPIAWQRQISNRAGVMLDTARGGFREPQPTIVSCVTGEASYNDHNSREILNRWIDEPQRLWDAVHYALSAGVELMIHVGPSPNIIPATMGRLSNNVASQLGAAWYRSLHLRFVSRMVRRHRPWLSRLLSHDATLLRAPFVGHVILEDWLLEQELN